MFEHSGGWIRALLEEAEGERMHLMTMVELVRPKWCERLLILTVLGFFFDAYFVLCLLSPEIARRIFSFLKMGRLFIVEFDNINTGKFYICQFCSMTFAKNTDFYQYWKRSGDVLEEFVCFSYSQRVSNVVDSGIIYEAYNVHHQNYDWQEVHCVSCNNPVGFKFKDRDNRSPPEFYSLNSDKIVFRIDGEDHDPEIVSPEDWFDPPRPSCGICFPSLDYSQNQQ